MKISFLVLVLSLPVVVCAQPSESTEHELVLPDGSQYQGSLFDGLLSGEGVLQWPNGDRYQGEFNLGTMTGRGTLTLASGDVFSGEFVTGQLQGQGRWQGEDGSHYVGGFKADEFHGPGEYHSAEGDVYQGDFVAGELTGLGTYQSADGVSYAGEFKGWHYHGAGVWQDDQRRYTGELMDGYFHGYGELYDLTRDEVDYAGRWRWGNQSPVAADKAQTRAARVAFEKALFSQEERLNQTLLGVRASVPGEVDLYALLLAGDGTQGVFDAEVRTIAEQLQSRWLDAEQVVTLSNLPESVDELPLATAGNLEATVAKLSQVMQPEEDILLLYITSHGSQEHEFSLAAPSHDFLDITPESLTAALAPLAATPKVLIISACYSGGFIDQLKAPQHLVLTAARHDRTSFGCGDADTMTYFGRAYFSKALPETNSFVKAFAKAKSYIKQWEQDQDVEHSQPQIFVGDSIEAILESL
ncbi:C13 family peptidase [Gilvimarinus sp. 1_MG-2023]|uniref:C13 family peptidase n=1 Tax=Gilvimarinus sp. 1_MG-2023 TaxID=3062638 RepID=UPI0026E301C0|nr:C13 family peptidase [Gilvimarinus sp. 1_MG-2023]MDO6747872.1 C13 family peptidase [Gilvimarinus sp. 1_MG-2023]